MKSHAILKDNSKKARYDRVCDAYFAKDKYQYSHTESTQENSRAESYSIHDEELKKDVKDAREYAEHLVSEFFANLRDTSQKAARGAWDESKGYVYFLIISAIVGLLVMTCSQ